MRQSIRFVRNGRIVALEGVAPGTTLLDWLRLDARAVGTKEGCGEGDCGACTVALGRLREGRIEYRPVNACILLLGMADGAEVVTVEDIGDPGDLHPVQEALARSHGSQCGFCTPGFVMSLFTLYHESEGPVPRERIVQWLSGNLCRCTGYRPIVDGARDALARPRADRFTSRRSETERMLADLDDDRDVRVTTDEGFFAAPRSLDALARLYAEHPDATLVAGATDVGLWLTKSLRDLPKIIWLGRVREFDRIEASGTELRIGAGCTYADAETALGAIDPDLGELLERLGSRQVRASGTIGGNIANGSPIGDMPPALIALGARLELRQGGRTRTLPLEDFFLAYGRQDRGPGEFVSAIIIPRLEPDRAFRCYKVTKRFDQDISAVMGAFAVTVRDGVLSDPVVAFGGLAGTPQRAPHAEAGLEGVRLNEPAGWQAALDALGADYTPLDDHRAGASYRLETARALLGKALAEIGGVPSGLTRIRGVRPQEAPHG